MPIIIECRDGDIVLPRRHVKEIYMIRDLLKDAQNSDGDGTIPMKYVDGRILTILLNVLDCKGKKKKIRQEFINASVENLSMDDFVQLANVANFLSCEWVLDIAVRRIAANMSILPDAELLAFIQHITKTETVVTEE